MDERKLWPQTAPVVRARLMDREQVQQAYATRTIKDAAKALGCGQTLFERALDYHRIPRRKRGEKPPGFRLTRADVRRLVLEAYRESDRCPPSCSGRDGCLTGRCVYEGERHGL